MTTDDKTRDEKLQYNINGEAAEILALSSGKIDKHKCPTDEELLRYDQSRIIEQAKSTYCLLGKAAARQKGFEDQGIKQLKL